MNNKGEADFRVNAYSKRVQNSEWKSDVSGQPAQPPIKCPECNSTKTWKAGLRYAQHGIIQRYLCRSCGYRFSDSEPQKKVNVISETRSFESSSNLAKSTVSNRDFSVKKNLNDGTFSVGKDVASHYVTVVGKGLNSLCSYNSKHQICVSNKEMKNLVKVEPQLETIRTSPIAEQLVNYILYLKRIGRKDSTIETYNSYINILSKSNLEDPDAIALFINEHWTENSTRSVAVSAYDAFLKSIGKTWNRPRYKQESKMPFIPTDEELQQTIMTGKKPSMTFFTNPLRNWSQNQRS